MNELLHEAIAFIVLIPLMGAFFTGLFSRLNKRLVFPVALLTVLCAGFFVGVLSQQVYSEGVVGRAIETGELSMIVPDGFGPVRIMLTADAMSVLLAISIALVSLFALVFAKKSIKEDNMCFYVLFLLMVGGAYGLVLTGDIFNMFVFLEIISISSAGLIVSSYRKRAPDSAFKFIVVSTLSALMFLFGVALLYSQYGYLNLAWLSQSIQWTMLDKIALTFMVMSLAMKAGSVPMHFWVPDAYGDAPASVSAVFVVVSQTALYALFRVCFSLFGMSLNNYTIGWVIIILGVLSMFIGVMMAIMQKDIKRLMAFHAVSQTGYILLGVGVGLATLGTSEFLDFGRMAMHGSVFHMLNHAIYKGLLFLTAGAVFYATGTRDLRKLGGLGHHLPLTTLFFMIGAFAITGLPPFNGFTSKLLIYESVYAFNPLLSAIALLVSILTLASFMKVFYAAFLGPKPKKKPKPIPQTMIFAMLVLSSLCIIIGLFPGVVLDLLIKPAVAALANVWSYAGVLGFV